MRHHKVYKPTYNTHHMTLGTIKDFVGGIANTADGFHESAEERSATLSERHRIDMTSDNWFSKSIRPLITIWTGLIWGTVTLVAIFKGGVDWEIYGIASAPFTTCIAWYFESRKREKMAAQNAKVAAENAKANIEIQKMQTKHELKQERKEARHERKLTRRRRRRQDDEDYDQNPTEILISLENENSE